MCDTIKTFVLPGYELCYFSVVISSVSIFGKGRHSDLHVDSVVIPQIYSNVRGLKREMRKMHAERWQPCFETVLGDRESRATF